MLQQHHAKHPVDASGGSVIGISNNTNINSMNHDHNNMDKSFSTTTENTTQLYSAPSSSSLGSNYSQLKCGVLKASRLVTDEDDATTSDYYTTYYNNSALLGEAQTVTRKVFTKNIVLALGRNETNNLGFTSQNAHAISYPKYLNPILRSCGVKEGYERVESIHTLSNDERGYTVFLTNFRKHFYVCGGEMKSKQKKQKKKSNDKKKQHQQEELFPPLLNPTAVPFLWKDEDDCIQQVALGNRHFFVLTKKRLYGMGSNMKYQLGLPKKKFTEQLVRVNVNNGDIVENVVCGVNCSFFITNLGKIFCCGDNDYGKLGVYKDEVYVPWQLPLTGVKSVHCGGSHTIFKKKDGTMYAAGNNLLGQCGIGSTELVPGLSRIPTFTDCEIVSIKCGENFTMFLTLSGHVYICGYFGFSTSSSVVNTDEFTYTSPTRITFFDSLNTFVTSIECGSDFAYFVTHRGDIYGAGSNYYGVLGDFSLTSSMSDDDEGANSEDEEEESFFDIHHGHSDSIQVITRLACFDKYRSIATKGWKVCSSAWSDNAFFIREVNKEIERLLTELISNTQFSDITLITTN
ncbi:hypothetical protein C9374_001079 [Naegleria lovaniensis]|uniref:Uncharacterized protein n=1 Tax=Naegleria lovaniensis TaxID=51637 RepID=A0AA88GY78_NAELO|nr:uncharacterized protein C9374_001079 [Naegleria lovaniensis]KAG2388229.1 hypothetical protein C9374_001079 [Naegleria lovaniensis]